MQSSFCNQKSKVEEGKRTNPGAHEQQQILFSRH